MLKFLALTFFLLPFLAFSAAWEQSDSPYKLKIDFNKKMDELPIIGLLADKRKGWPASHWASYLGSIAHRWSSSNPQNFQYPLSNLEELKNKEVHELEELSPAEKFDIFAGRYHYPMTKAVLSEVSPYESEWHGICHGVAPASLNHPEPKTVTLTNADGITLTFYSSDVAGLLSYYYAKKASTPVTFIGKRCYNRPGSRRGWRFWSDCNGLNPGSFHLILANTLGNRGETFIADIDRYNEVWNHVAVEYRSYIHGELPSDSKSAKEAIKRIQVETLVKYAAAIAPKFDPVIGTENAEYLENTYEYYLDVNSAGEIVGGEWISEIRPDFIWFQGQANFTNEWSVLKEIYQPITDNLDSVH